MIVAFEDNLWTAEKTDVMGQNGHHQWWLTCLADPNMKRFAHKNHCSFVIKNGKGNWVELTK